MTSPSMRERFAGSRRTRHAARLDFPDHADDAAAPDVEVDAPQDVGGAPRGRRLERQFPDRHQRRH
jgi:hypothetical protein